MSKRRIRVSLSNDDGEVGARTLVVDEGLGRDMAAAITGAVQELILAAGYLQVGDCIRVTEVHVRR